MYGHEALNGLKDSIGDWVLLYESGLCDLKSTPFSIALLDVLKLIKTAI
jgi:hypothetical protein